MLPTVLEERAAVPCERQYALRTSYSCHRYDSDTARTQQPGLLGVIDSAVDTCNGGGAPFLF